jgi:hypothetical protein
MQESPAEHELGGIRLSRPRSSGVEHFLGKEEVIGSKPIAGSRNAVGRSRFETITALLGLES